MLHSAFIGMTFSLMDAHGVESIRWIRFMSGRRYEMKLPKYAWDIKDEGENKPLQQEKKMRREHKRLGVWLM